MDAADAAALERAREALRATRVALDAADARTEALAELVQPRAVLGIARAPRLRRLDEAWRLGPLLLGVDGALWATGSSVRVAEPGRPQHLSRSAEERRAMRAAALRGGFAIGTTVNHDVRPIALDATLVGGPPPLSIEGGEALVRWGSDAPVPLERHLADLSSLLLDPPAGA